MIKNHTHNNDSGSIHYIFKKILDLDNIKEAFAFIPLSSKVMHFPTSFAMYLSIIVFFYFLFDPFKIKYSLVTSSFVYVVF